MMLEISMAKQTGYFEVRFMGRHFIMDTFELLYFLPLAVFGLGPSRAQALIDKVKEKGTVLQEVGVKFETIPAIYMRTQI